MSAPAELIAAVKSQAAADKYPTLTDPEISEAVEATLRATVWLPSTVYAPGSLVVPSVRNGVIWRAIVAGTSGTIEPDWLLIWDPQYPWIFQDNTTYWQAHSSDNAPSLYDERDAIYRCWLKKASKASGNFAYSEGAAGGASPQTVMDQCLSMAKRYRSWWVK